MLRLSAIIPCIALVVVASRPAAAQDQEPQPPSDKVEVPPEPPPPAAKSKDPSHSAESVAEAPKPRDAHNRSVEPDRSGEGLLWIPRVIFFPVRVVGLALAYPIERGLYAYEKYNLGPRVKGIFFNEEGTAGVFPTAFVETGFGLNVGGRLILRRIARDTGLTGRAGFGGRFRQIFSGKISTNESFEHFEFDLEGIYEVRPRDRFFGIGNGDESDEVPAMPLDPFGDVQRESHYRQDAFRLTFGGAYRLTDVISLRASGAFIDRVFADGEDGTDDDEQIAVNFDTGALTGFAEGSQIFYSELELSYDSRRASNRWEGDSTPSTGWLAKAYAGYSLGLSDDPARYVRYGADLQRYFRLGDGPRTLALRLYLEGVTGSYGEVSFHDLPRLGGPLLLRGYARDQYRDRVATLGSVEYQFDMSEVLGGFLFVDGGRVYPNLDALELTGTRVGFGGGFEIHTKTSFLGRLMFATSPDGGFFVSLNFDPVYDTRGRVERK